MFVATGLKSKKIYAKGDKAEVSRKLCAKFPSQNQQTSVYPEKLIIHRTSRRELVKNE